MPRKVHVQTQINGEDVEYLCDPRQSLLEVLREVLSLTGTKEGCNDGNCGACSVIIDGRLVDSCLVLGVEAQSKEIRRGCTRSSKHSWKPQHYNVESVLPAS